MAAKRFLTIIIILAAITAIAILQYQRHRHTDSVSTDDEKFVLTYTELAVARETFAGDIVIRENFLTKWNGLYLDAAAYPEYFR